MSSATVPAPLPTTSPRTLLGRAVRSVTTRLALAALRSPARSSSSRSIGAGWPSVCTNSAPTMPRA